MREERCVKNLCISGNRSNNSLNLAATFNEVAERYDRMRPTYVDALYQDIFTYMRTGQEPTGQGGLGAPSKALEIGIGTGQATLPILETGCFVTAVELGDKMAAYCAKKFEQYDNFAIYNMRFEEFEAEPASFDLIYSATAFHWIPEEIGYKKVYDLLKPGGTFARFANHPSGDRGRPELSEAIQRLYERYMPGSQGKKKSEPGFVEMQARQLAELGENYGFVDVTYRLYERTRNFTAEEYVELLGTYSDHNVLEKCVREEFWTEMKDVIHRFGGVITVYDTIDLQLYRKPAGISEMVCDKDNAGSAKSIQKNVDRP